MDKAQAALPVIPVLSYANPQSAQPANGRLKMEYHEGEVTLIDPKPIATSPALIKGVGIALIALGTLIAVTLAWNGYIYDGHFFAAIAAVICGMLALFRAPAQLKPHSIRVSNRRAHTTACPEHDWMSGRFVPRELLISRGGTQLKNMTILYSLKISYRFGVKFTLFQSLSLDEAIWAVDLLNKALNGNFVET